MRKSDVGHFGYAARAARVAVGLISYGTDFLNVNRRICVYVGRLLKREDSRNLPVRLPTSFQLVLNLKAARQIGLPIPPSVLARADEVIE
jgi:putative ABC transport system substrate-binding protein